MCKIILPHQSKIGQGITIICYIFTLQEKSYNKICSGLPAMRECWNVMCPCSQLSTQLLDIIVYQFPKPSTKGAYAFSIMEIIEEGGAESPPPPRFRGPCQSAVSLLSIVPSSSIMDIIAYILINTCNMF